MAMAEAHLTFLSEKVQLPCGVDDLPTPCLLVDLVESSILPCVLK